MYYIMLVLEYKLGTQRLKPFPIVCVFVQCVCEKALLEEE